MMFIENDDNFILGRGHESDVRISDISVSRSHAKIIFRDKKFTLEDTGSKFGTLVLAKHPLTIKENPVVLQIGRTLISAVELKGDQLQNFKPPKEMKVKKGDNFKFECKLEINKLI